MGSVPPMTALRCLAPCLLIALAGCNKAPGIPTTDPEFDGSVDAPEGGADVPLASGTVLRYDTQPRTLEQRGQLEMVQRGAGQYAEAVLDLSAKVTVEPQANRLKVAWSIADVANLELRGALQVTGAEDPKAFLVEYGTGAYLCDLRGQAEDDPSLPENAQREAKLDAVHEEIRKATEAGAPPPVVPGLQMLSYLPPLLQLPSLPEQPLPLGEPVKVERQEETELGDTGLLLPFDVEVTYELVRIDTSGGERLAEMTFQADALGRREGPEGEVVIASQQHGSLLFNLDAQIPVSYEATRTETYEFGQFSSETETSIRATWEL